MESRKAMVKTIHINTHNGYPREWEIFLNGKNIAHLIVGIKIEANANDGNIPLVTLELLTGVEIEGDILCEIAETIYAKT